MTDRSPHRPWPRLLPVPFLRALLLFLGASASCSSTPPTPDAKMAGCLVTADCKNPSLPICDPLSFTCRACQGAMDDGACADSNQATPICGPAGTCIAGCKNPGQSSECTNPLQPTCSAGVCQACSQAADCLSNACKSDGSCYPDSVVVHVNNQGGQCDGTKAHAGSLADPLCDLPAGWTLLVSSQKAVIQLAGSATPYSPLVITTAVPAGGVLITGANLPTVLGSGPAITLSGVAGTQGPLTVEGMNLSSSQSDVVLCNQKTSPVAPVLSVLQSTLQGGLTGVHSIGCTLTLDRLQVHDLQQGGVLIDGGLYTINNLFVYSNGGPGIAISNAAAGSLLRFSTIYGNTAVGQSGSGVTCGGQSTLVADSIVVSNFGGASQFLGCQLQNVVTGSETISGGTALQPTFVSAVRPFDLHLTNSAADMACCIDKIMPPAAPAPALIGHDIDGRKRPQGTAWDIGAHEVSL